MNTMLHSSFSRLLLLLLVSLPVTMQAQTDTAADSAMAVVYRLFDAMREADSAKVNQCFAAEGRIQTLVGINGPVTVQAGSIKQFASAVGKSRPLVWDERVWGYRTQVDGPLAQIFVDFGFYLSDTLLHCGVDAFQLVRTAEGWKILQLIDTRREATDLTTYPAGAVHMVLDRWHIAAARADENVFFKLMAADAIYVGTDVSERWSREEMRVWAKTYFDRNSAWDFLPHNRQVYLTEDGKTAWFEENLDTWMGPCRGSGVLTKNEKGQWLIKQYVLSVCLPNDAVKPYLKILAEMPNPPVIREK
jgi:SnoaL-like domain